MPKNLRIALYQPDIAGNVGTIIRSCACFGAKLHIIEPCGFPFDMQRVRKAALDYIDHVEIFRHNSFADFMKTIKDQQLRLILLTTKTQNEYQNLALQENDIFLFGSESAGVPAEVAEACDEKMKIIMKENMRSLNIAVSCGIIMAHAAIN